MWEVVRKGEGTRERLKCWMVFVLLLPTLASGSWLGDRAVQLKQRRPREMQKRRKARERSQMFLPDTETGDKGSATGTAPCFNSNIITQKGVTVFRIKKAEPFYRDLVVSAWISPLSTNCQNITRSYIHAGYVTGRAHVRQQISAMARFYR